MKLSPDGKLVTLLQDRAPTSRTATTCGRSTPRPARSGCWSNSKKVGTGAELSEAEKMQRERARIAGQKGIVAYDWAPDGKSILVPLDGDLYLATLDGKVTRLTNTPGGELNPSISPAGGYRQLRPRPESVRPAARRRRGARADQRRRRHRPLGRGGVRRAGGNGPPHRLLVVARRRSSRSSASTKRRSASSPARRSARTGPRCSSSAIPPPAPPTCRSTST